jgi:hypothetical protein
LANILIIHGAWNQFVQILCCTKKTGRIFFRDMYQSICFAKNEGTI